MGAQCRLVQGAASKRRARRRGRLAAMLPWPLGPLWDTCHTQRWAATPCSSRRAEPVHRPGPLTQSTAQAPVGASPRSPSPPRGSPLPFLPLREPNPDSPGAPANVLFCPPGGRREATPAVRSAQPGLRAARVPARARPSPGPSAGAAGRLRACCLPPPRFPRRAFFVSLWIPGDAVLALGKLFYLNYPCYRTSSLLSSIT